MCTVLEKLPVSLHDQFSTRNCAGFRLTEGVRALKFQTVPLTSTMRSRSVRGTFPHAMSRKVISSTVSGRSESISVQFALVELICKSATPVVLKYTVQVSPSRR